MEGENAVAALPQDFGLAVARDPKTVIAEAKRAADSLKAILDAKPKETWVMMNSERYLEYEDWATVAKFYGVTAKVVSTSPVEIGGVRGWEARAVAFHGPTGIEVSAADAMCLNDEDKWSTRAKYEWKDDLDANGKKIWVEGKDGKKGYYKGKREKVGEVAVPSFQLRSMAQTRACAKVLKNVFSWVVVLAGFKPQVAEEMTGDEATGNAETKTPIADPKPKEAAKPAESANTDDLKWVEFIPAQAKESKARNGNPYWFAKTIEGVSYSTKDGEQGGILLEAYQNKYAVKVGFKVNGEYNNIAEVHKV